MISLIILLLGLASGIAADYGAPAGTRPAIHRPGAPSILPGGRIIAPLGKQYITGPGPFGLAVSPDGKTIISVNSGPERFSVSVLEKDKSGSLAVHHWVTRPQTATSGAACLWALHLPEIRLHSYRRAIPAVCEW